MVQWLRLQAPSAGGPGLTPVRGLDPTCCSKEFACINYRTHMLQLKRTHVLQLRPVTAK